VNGKTLREEAKGCRNCCILICDITRPVPNSLILPVLVKELLDAGMAPGAILLSLQRVSIGLMRGMNFVNWSGSDWILDNVIVANHFGSAG